MLIFSSVLSSKVNEVLFHYIHNINVEGLKKAGFYNIDEYSFSFDFISELNTKISVRFTDEFSFYLLECKEENQDFEKIASFNLESNEQIDIKMLNKAFINEFNSKIHFLLK